MEPPSYGLPEDSRGADERLAERRLGELRARVKAARAVVATTPGLPEPLARDWRKAASFYARFGITELAFQLGARVVNGRAEGSRRGDFPETPVDAGSEASARAQATLPE